MSTMCGSTTAKKVKVLTIFQIVQQSNQDDLP